MDTLARLNRFHESYVEAYTASNRGRGRRRLHPRNWARRDDRHGRPERHRSHL